MGKILFYRNGNLQSEEAAIVREFPLVLTVNGQELATLIASPHDLIFLVAGFLRLQGFVREIGDLEMMGVCDDFGIANVRIRGELPKRLRPTLTSGCGTGITFTLASPGKDGGQVPTVPAGVFPISTVLALMEELARKAESYRNHGGIHSAAVGDEGGVLIYAEDIGRHNTLDRIAGEALLKSINLVGKALVTSGRVSTEMVAKAVQLGISLIASRTSPTDMAVKMCDEAGITLIGYLRASKFNVYSHPECLVLPGAPEDRLPAKPAAAFGMPGAVISPMRSERTGGGSSAGLI